MTDALVILITAPDEEKAASLAQALVGERLAACVNLVPRVRSIYRWEGKICDEAEVLMVCKTERRCFDAFQRRVAALHPYEIPEVLALPVEQGAERYLAWLRGSLIS